MSNVCFTPNSGHRNSVVECPLCAKSRLMHCSTDVAKFSVEPSRVSYAVSIGIWTGEPRTTLMLPPRRAAETMYPP
jgi:hypothetical protein